MADDVFAPGLDRGVFLQHLGLRRRENAIESPEDSEREDDLAILVPLVWPTEQIADAPNKTRELRMRFRRH